MLPQSSVAKSPPCPSDQVSHVRFVSPNSGFSSPQIVAPGVTYIHALELLELSDELELEELLLTEELEELLLTELEELLIDELDELIELELEDAIGVKLA